LPLSAQSLHTIIVTTMFVRLYLGYDDPVRVVIDVLGLLFLADIKFLSSGLALGESIPGVQSASQLHFGHVPTSLTQQQTLLPSRPQIR
jgi:hypothetical protein